MAGIHGLVFLIFGIAISVFAYFVNSKTDTAGLNFFMWIGVVMAAYGLVKLFITRAGVSKKEEKTPDEKLKNMMQKQSIKYCAKCGTKLPTRANFCYMCGTKS